MYVYVFSLMQNGKCCWDGIFPGTPGNQRKQQKTQHILILDMTWDHLCKDRNLVQVHCIFCGFANSKCSTQMTQILAKLIIFHQPRFPWNSVDFPQKPQLYLLGGVLSVVFSVAMKIWPEPKRIQNLAFNVHIPWILTIPHCMPVDSEVLYMGVS